MDPAVLESLRQDPESILSWLEKQHDISEQDKESIRQAILGGVPVHQEQEEAAYVDPGINVNAERLLIVFVCCVLIYAAVFFGYKLYRSLSDRERKKEDKRKIKATHKKKK